MKKINIREALLDIDRRTDAQYDLTTLYEACKLSEDDKKKVVKYIDTKKPPFMIGEFLASKCDAVCEAIVGDDEVSEADMKKIVDDINDGSDHTLWALMDKADELDEALRTDDDWEYCPSCGERSLKGTGDDTAVCDKCGDSFKVVHMPNNRIKILPESKSLTEDLIDIDLLALESKIRAAAKDVVVNKLGYDEGFADKYVVIEVGNTDEEDARVRVEVRADLSYEEAQEVADVLNPIVREYDKDAYFDAVTHNTIEAYIRLDQSDDFVDEEAFNYWKNIFDKVTTRGDLINYYKELVHKRDEGSITWGTMDKLFDEVISPLNDTLDESLNESIDHYEILNWLSEHEQAYEDAERYFKGTDLADVAVNDLVAWIQDHDQLFADFQERFGPVDLDEAAVGTMERPMTELQGTLSSILSSDWNAWAKIRHVEDAVAFLNEIAPQCKNKGYIEKVKSKLLSNPRTNIQQFFTNIIMAGDGQSVVKTGKSKRMARDMKEGIQSSSLYLFPELTAEDLEMVKAYGLTYLGKNYGPDGSENNCVVAGDMSSLQRYADKYLGYELHPDYLYDDADDFAGEIIKEEVELTNCPNCGGERFNDNTGLCVDCGYDEKGNGDLDESKSLKEDNDERFTLVRTKSVPDSDGFNTDYTMYYDHDNDKYVFVFGDRDIYTPEDGYFDWECETVEQAYQWFDSYEGFADDEDTEMLLLDEDLLTEGPLGKINTAMQKLGNNSNFQKAKGGVKDVAKGAVGMVADAARGIKNKWDNAVKSEEEREKQAAVNAQRAAERQPASDPSSTRAAMAKKYAKADKQAHGESDGSEDDPVVAAKLKGNNGRANSASTQHQIFTNAANQRVDPNGKVAIQDANGQPKEYPAKEVFYIYKKGSIQKRLTVQQYNNLSAKEAEYVTGAVHKSQAGKVQSEAVEDGAVSAEEVARQMKEITHNFTDDYGYLQCGFESEQQAAYDVLKQHYADVNTGKRGNWFWIDFNEKITDAE